MLWNYVIAYDVREHQVHDLNDIFKREKQNTWR